MFVKSVIILMTAIVAINCNEWSINFKDLKVDIHPSLVEEFLKEIENADTRAGGITAICNEYADKIFVNIENMMITNGLDPMQLPDQHAGFSFLLFKGELNLTLGWLSNVATLHRSGDVVVQYSTDNKDLSVAIPMTFNDLSISYDYLATIMDLGPRGGIEGKVSDINVDVIIGFNFETYRASLEKFNLPDTGHVSFHFTGNALVDWLLNILTDLVAVLLKGVVMVVVESLIRGTLNNAVQAINDLVDSILNPTTTALPTTPQLLFGA